MAYINDKYAEYLVEQVQEIADKSWISLQKLFWVVLDTKNHTKETIENSYSGFWNPDDDEKKKIDSWSEEYREKVRWKIEFWVDTQKWPATILTLPTWKKLTFDKTPILDSDTKKRDWYEAIKFAEEKDRKLLSPEDFEQLFELFKWNKHELKRILNITHNGYWSSTTDANITNDAWYGSFYFGGVYSSYKNDTNLYTICTHN